MPGSAWTRNIRQGRSGVLPSGHSLRSHLLSVRVNLCLGERDGGAAAESEGPVLSPDIPGTGVFEVSEGCWVAAA